jgi:hypothetical protein
LQQRVEILAVFRVRGFGQAVSNIFAARGRQNAGLTEPVGERKKMS